MDKLKNILRKKKKEIEKIQNQEFEQDTTYLKKRDLEEFKQEKKENIIEDKIEDNSQKMIEEIIQNFKKEKKLEIKEEKENIIKKWDFKITEKELKNIKETNNLLKSKLKSCKKYYPKVDYLKKEVDYTQRSNQLKNFIIFSINKINDELVYKNDNNLEKKDNLEKIVNFDKNENNEKIANFDKNENNEKITIEKKTNYVKNEITEKKDEKSTYYDKIDNFEIKEKKTEDLKILEKVKKDIQYLFLYLNEYVN